MTRQISPTKCALFERAGFAVYSMGTSTFNLVQKRATSALAPFRCSFVIVGGADSSIK